MGYTLFLGLGFLGMLKLSCELCKGIPYER